MKKFYEIRELLEDDCSLVKEVYEDAILSQGYDFYNEEQIQAWSALARVPGVLDKTLKDGKGWVISHKTQIEAFAVRYPLNRLALLYCRGRSSRRGYATRLITRIEIDAIKENQKSLYAEASMFSYPLLIRCGWKEKALEKITIAGVPFDRYLMEKILM